MINDNNMGGAEKAASFLKSLANKNRLMILCELSTGEKSVTQIIEKTGIAQTSVSQHLAKLKQEGIVSFRRDHRILYYSISNDAVLDIMSILYDLFCKDDDNL